MMKIEAKQPNFVQTQTELARILGVTRKTVNVWSKDSRSPRPKSDGRLPVSEWISYARENSRPGTGTAEDKESKQELEKRRLRAQCNRLELEYSVARGEYTANAEIREAHIKAGALLNARFQRLEVDLAGSLVGLSSAQIQVKVREKLDDVRLAFQSELNAI